MLDRLGSGRTTPLSDTDRAWRDTLATPAEPEASVAHVETWSLPDGRSLSLTARRQADATTTLLLEDVSQAVVRRNTHRQEQKMFADVLDQMNTAVIAFDPAGERTVATGLGQAVWFAEGRDVPLPKTLGSCLTLWASISKPTPLWGEIRDLFQGPLEARSAWDEDVTLADGTALWVRVLPQSDGGLALALRSDREIIPTVTILPDPPALTA